MTTSLCPASGGVSPPMLFTSFAMALTWYQLYSPLRATGWFALLTVKRLLPGPCGPLLLRALATLIEGGSADGAAATWVR